GLGAIAVYDIEDRPGLPAQTERRAEDQPRPDLRPSAKRARDKAKTEGPSFRSRSVPHKPGTQGADNHLTLSRPPLRASAGQFADRVYLRWQSVPGAVAYRVERREPTAKKFEFVAHTRTNRFVDWKVQRYVAYAYR